MTGTPLAPLRLYVIRHGETEWSLTGQHTGRTDIPLTAHGRDEARALKPWLAHIRFDRVLMSPLQRARDTADLAGFGSIATVEPDLAEWNYGDYEGRLSVDIRRERPGWSMFKDGCPNGESPSDLSARADRLVERLSRLSGHVALFSHGEIGRALGVRWIGLPFIAGEHLSFSTASLSILTFKSDDHDVRVIETWNAGPALSAGPA
ncbi:MAG: histidine phosphatase family protein [Ancalomicrobiaceae bacterium]|nr:histidine phosphatase family protein [Ancalomicrobiaceae bacterium]